MMMTHSCFNILLYCSQIHWPARERKREGGLQMERERETLTLIQRHNSRGHSLLSLDEETN